MPTRVKLDIVIRQEGRCACGCGHKLGTLKEAEFDHVPALTHRKFDAVTKEYDPPANDPARIFAKRVECHAKKTRRDVRDKYHIDRLEREQSGLPKRKRKSRVLKSRGFDKTMTRHFDGSVTRHG